jgi:hypothetical protein
VHLNEILSIRSLDRNNLPHAGKKGAQKRQTKGAKKKIDGENNTKNRREKKPEKNNVNRKGAVSC